MSRKNLVSIRIEPETKKFFKSKFPKASSEPMRMKMVKCIVEEFDTNKLKPELTDTKQDRIMKRMMRELMGK